MWFNSSSSNSSNSSSSGAGGGASTSQSTVASSVSGGGAVGGSQCNGNCGNSIASNQQISSTLTVLPNNIQIKSPVSCNELSAGNSKSCNGNQTSNHTTNSKPFNLADRIVTSKPANGSQQQQQQQQQQQISGDNSRGQPLINPLNASTQQQQQQRQHSTHTGASTGHISGNKFSNKITFHLKTSIFTKRVTVDTDKLALGTIKQLAIEFINELYFQDQYPAGTFIGDYIRRNFSHNDNISSLFDRLVFKIHKPELNTFLPFNSVSDIEIDSFICVEVSERNFHLLNLNTSQSLSATQIMHSSTATTTTATTPATLSTSATSTSGSNAPQISGSQFGKTGTSASQQGIMIAHDFHSETFLFPAFCTSCSKLIKGVYKQGHQCSFCKKNFCNDCKAKALSTADGCSVRMSSILPNVSGQLSAVGSGGDTTETTTASKNEPASTSNKKNGTESSGILSAAGQNHGSGGNIAMGNRLEAHSSSQSATMSKRKSVNNLLPFNLPNPFRSHHSSQQQSAVSQNEDSKSPKMKAGALEPVLQQLSKMSVQDSSGRQQQHQAPTSATATTEEPNALLQVQSAHLSSSHHNLFAGNGQQDVTASEQHTSAIGSASVHQSPISTPKKANISQISNSARTSYHDIHAKTSSIRREHSHHVFVSQEPSGNAAGESPCGVCKRPLKSQQQQLPFVCKLCRLQVHVQCQSLAPDDCVSRVAEANRAAAERQVSITDSVSAQDPDSSDPTNRAGIRNTNSNVSRDNIRLHRLAPSVKHIKRPDATKPIIEGWLRHTTLSDEQARKHYWRLDDTDITLYENDTSMRYFKAIAVSKITRVISGSSLPKRLKEDVLMTTAAAAAAEEATKKTKGSHGNEKVSKPKSANTSPVKSSEFQAQMRAMFAFELKTGSVYLVTANDEEEASKWRGSLVDITAKLNNNNNNNSSSSSNQPAANKEQSANNENKNKVDEIKQEPRKQTCEATDSSAKETADVTTSQQQQPTSGASKAVTATTAEATSSTTTETTPTAINEVKPSGGAIINSSTETSAKNTITTKTDDTQHTAQAASDEQAKGKQGKLITTTAAAPKHATAAPNQRHHHTTSGLNYRGQNRTYTDPTRSRLYNRPRITIQLDPQESTSHYIVRNDETTNTEHRYMIEGNRDGKGFRELGSGQFGKVYAAISEIKKEDPLKGLWSGIPVAIKEISKARFDLRQQARLKNEANILSRLDHPGVIILERVHDLPDKIYIVMEQLEDDMLEMIVSSEEKRLNERVTKFLIYQILEALKHLHSKNIAHCDLKPENVLLVERRSQFPQIKLCDFGFAKIIEENSFRNSLVGTPAYLAPEVVKGERYNRSVDLWSVGVIVYVSLSGEFPFNEGEHIPDQISRANFMYPDQPWAKISVEAKNFINSLLQLNCERRLSAYRAQNNVWIQDYQLWCDLIELEVRVGKRWVTDDADYKRWSAYAKENGLQIPRSAIQLHEELIAN